MKINIPGFNLTQRNPSVLSNPGVRNKIGPSLKRMYPGVKHSLLGEYMSPIPIRGDIVQDSYEEQEF